MGDKINMIAIRPLINILANIRFRSIIAGKKSITPFPDNPIIPDNVNGPV
jgi:hypothetical protein